MLYPAANCSSSKISGHCSGRLFDSVTIFRWNHLPRDFTIISVYIYDICPPWDSSGRDSATTGFNGIFCTGSNHDGTRRDCAGSGHRGKLSATGSSHDGTNRDYVRGIPRYKRRFMCVCAVSKHQGTQRFFLVLDAAAKLFHGTGIFFFLLDLQHY